MAGPRVVLPTGLLGVVLLAGCGGTTHEPARAGSLRTDPTSAPAATTTATTTASRAPHAKTPWRDPRWRFYARDHRLHRSAWFAGRHRVMIPFGCTRAPWYDPDPSCPHGQGKHHGIDVAMPCGTPLFAGRAATVLDNASLGSAYGTNPVLLRVGHQDVVIGHTRRVFVRVSGRVATGERFALAGDSGAPDGCHLHFEVRPAGGGYTTAVDPSELLGLR